MLRCLLACGLLLSMLGVRAMVGAEESPTATNDWTQWRGCNRDGQSTEVGLLKTWPDSGPTLAWSVSNLGKGWSSVAIADGMIVTMGDRDQEEYLIALDAADGHELWATKVGPGWKDGPRSTPTIDRGNVYGLSPNGDLICAELRSGEIRWAKNLQTDFGGRMMSHWGYSESVLVDGERLICTPGAQDAGLVALDRSTGKTIWKTSLADLGQRGKDGAAYSSVVISEGAGVRQYVQLLGRGAVGVNAEDGRFLWSYNRIANGTANIPTPIVRGDYVFCTTGYQTGAALLKLVRNGEGVDAQEVYFLPATELQNHHGGMVLIGDYLYGGHGHKQGFPICLEFATGKVAWREGRGAGSGSAAVVYADGNLYFRYENGVMALIEATPEGYHLHGKFEIPDCNDPSWALPVVAHGKLYLREQNHLYVYPLR